ncbi:hypothetical protein CEXT_93961 [Caerostris extrusa]|uniref:Uncharacterized protein n=1 Tax=Caerostris extrusa TaxID=172846 RepID=A0AAV4U7H5_CAEEX|nr:hypothetical protein CEXT_93961 [Caerostris extrusa]
MCSTTICYFGHTQTIPGGALPRCLFQHRRSFLFNQETFSPVRLVNEEWEKKMVKKEKRNGKKRERKKGVSWRFLMRNTWNEALKEIKYRNSPAKGDALKSLRLVFLHLSVIERGILRPGEHPERKG